KRQRRPSSGTIFAWQSRQTGRLEKVRSGELQIRQSEGTSTENKLSAAALNAIPTPSRKDKVR
ncbi:MAG TPA: hypothetical protein VFT65_20925, partial [Candidatus Angelobacter sp.]|nr:hypothetical protein [Candidatus Angelobacter sp.]